MFQTAEPAVRKSVATRKPKKKEIIPFDTSVKISDGADEVILSFTGTFEGSKQNLEALEFAFMSQVMKGKKNVRMKILETFHANGHKAFLAKAVHANASKVGKKIIIDDFGFWSDVSHIFHKN